jgi:hypothetical protein
MPRSLKYHAQGMDAFLAAAQQGLDGDVCKQAYEHEVSRLEDAEDNAVCDARVAADEDYQPVYKDSNDIY